MGMGGNGKGKSHSRTPLLWTNQSITYMRGSKVGSNKLRREVVNEENVIYAKFGNNLLYV